MTYSGKSREKPHFQLQLSKVNTVKLREVLLTSTSWIFDTISVDTNKFKIAQNCVNSPCHQRCNLHKK